ncbi:hypothetical protein E0Z10_g1144 [Xylaria hypoxylon]|uniref:Xylanolytic transcriptional activator regulatory domain-containing protein n=1 Tax=Xylaria hypoxylon TaxID=37992 RepID=A0A4Z0YU78_9PEZI|nr:hypothetical protein E0Z10_g1144 [Xylaria hypoxylon]
MDDCGHESMTDEAVTSGVNGEPTSPQAELVDDPHIVENTHASHVPGFGGNSQAEIQQQGQQQQQQQQQQPHAGFNGYPQSGFNRPLNTTQAFNNASSIPPQSFNMLGNPELPLWVGEQQIALNADITYSYYQFLTISNLHNVIPHDVNFLESQGCLRIPTRAILDEFMQQYFLHVHPLLPFINEGHFWNLYCHQGSIRPDEKMSLLVFQAMMFSCCNFVSKNSIKALGFPDIRTARATLYRRTKLLFDFDTESSLICLAQAALLLTYWAPNWSLATKKPNTAWLGVAVQNAKSAEAHIYSAMPTFCPVTEPMEYKKQNSLKRLWWCCIIRDRLISLGMRRSIQISRAHFDVGSNSGFGLSDLAEEVGQSRVYNPETKRRLIEIFVQLGELCSVLTDLLTLVFPLDDVPGWGRLNGIKGAEKVRECKAALRRWYKAATLRFPMFGGSNASSKTTGDKHLRHDSVILYTNLTYMFYHSARAALCHHEVLQAAMASASPNLNSSVRGFSNVYESRHELQDAACGVTECLNELIQRRLARWLPISAISCTAMPLVLHIIDVKLLSQNKRSRATPDEKRRTALKQQRLNVLIEAMKTYQPQYDGVDYISETIRHIVNLAQIDPPSNSANTPSSITVASQDPANSMQPIISDWTDILASNPGSYLRLSMTMDISISKGRLAKETDFPVKLRGIFAHGFSPIRALLAGNHARIPPAFATGSPAPALFAPDPTAHIQPGSVHSVSSDEDSTSPGSTDNSGGTLENNNEMTSESPPFPPPGSDGADADLAMHIHTDMFVDSGGPMSLDIDYTLTADAYVLETNTDSNSNSNDGDDDGAKNKPEINDESGGGGGGNMYDDAGREVDWIAWDDEGDGADAGDKETARVLLDAMRDDAFLCAVTG